MSENKTERFIQAAVLLVLLLCSAVFTSEHYMGCLLTGTALFVVFNLQSLTDEQSMSSLVVQGILSLLFALLAGGFFAYLIFYELRFGRCKWLRAALPGLLCFAGAGALPVLLCFAGAETLPVLLWHALLLTACSGMLFVIEGMISHYLSVQAEAAAAVKVSALNELFEKKLNHELRMKHYLAERNARLEERENISRNIHNSVGHTITAAIMTLDAAEMLLDVDTGKAKERIVTAKERMKDGLNSIRCAVRVLDKENHAVSMEDFLSELETVADDFVMDTELEVKTDVNLPTGVLKIPGVHTEFLTGAVQELLTNGVKHGGANRFWLSVTADSGHLQVSVRDNGSGDFSEENKAAKIREGFGLKKIVSYVKKCGGSVKLTNENGFCAILTLPLYQEGEDGEL
ncbi:MAG: histidine kinase [Lachnospiraceae bacterium]|nr:histidine kinase [Lachnospiraceae bacterium]